MNRVEKIQKYIEDSEKKIQELQKKLEIEKAKTEIECPFEERERYFVLCNDGSVSSDCWEDYDCELDQLSQVNMFKTKEEAECERDRRNLLARLNRFRNEKNDGWIPNWNRWQELKFCIFWSYGDLILKPCDTFLGFNVFGYFKNRDDCLEAIRIFGHEIKRLYVEELGK